MNSNFSRLVIGLGLCCGSALSIAAGDPVDRSVITMGASYGYYDFAKDRGLDNRDFFGLSMGLQLHRTFSLALFYSRTHVDDEQQVEHRFEHYFVEGAWYFNTDSVLRPYLITGIGETMLAEGKIADDTTLQAGAGLNWVVNENWSLRGDVRATYVLDEHTTDHLFMTSLVYRFGTGERNW
jgi:hypothetical protein